MKDVFKFILFIISILFVCCTVTPEQENAPGPVEYIYYKGTDPGVYKEPVIKFEYNGHSYIRFGEFRCTSIVHDPDCPCHKNAEPIYNDEIDY